MKTVLPVIACLTSLIAVGGDVARAQLIGTNDCENPFNRVDYSRFTVAEAALYAQSDASGAFPATTNAFGVEATVTLATGLTASAATVQFPNQAARPMIPEGTGKFLFDVVTNSASNIAAAFPSGDYAFTVSNNMTTVPVPAGGTLPNPPVLNNFAAAQAVDPSKDFTLSWGAFSGATSRDFISVTVNGLGGPFKTEDFGCPGSLNGTDIAAIIPANTLASNQVYRVAILFVHVLTLDTNSIPGVALLAGAETETEMSISTLGAPGSTLYLRNAAEISGGGVRFDLATTPGLTYTVQFNQDLGNPAGWTPLLVTNASGSLVSFTNPPPSGSATGFYRAYHN